MNYIEIEDFDRFPIAPATNFDQSDFVTAVLRAYESIASLPKAKKRSISDVPLTQLAFEMVRTQGVSSALFRRAENAEEILTLAWLSCVRRTATTVALTTQCGKYNGLSQEQLEEIREFAVDPSNIEHLQRHLAELGILLIYEDSIPSMKLDGATFKIGEGTPVVALSLRYSRYDYFWFTLMHELSHVLLHYETLDEPILDNLDEANSTSIEAEANAFASDILIPRSDWRTCSARGTRKEEDVIAFAEKIGSHPIIVAGRLRRELNRFGLFAKLVNSIDVRALLHR